MTSRSPANPYLRTKILTASPEELRMMLYEGAIRFCMQGREAIEKKDWESSYSALMKAQKVVLELSTSLNHNVAPELCQKLSALYTYIYRRLVDANIQHELAAVDEAIRLLDYEKQTWQMLMTRVSGADAAPPPAAMPVQPATPPHAGVAKPVGPAAQHRANMLRGLAIPNPAAKPPASSSISLNG